MTETEIAEIEERAAGATPGPWWSLTGAAFGTPNIVATLEEETYVTSADPVIWRLKNSHGNIHALNQEFIAHAREDIPALLAEVRRLRGWWVVVRDYMQEIGIDGGIAADFAEDIASKALRGEEAPSK